MDLNKLTQAERIIAGCGAALVVFSFLPWFGYGGSDHNAWKNAFSALGVLLGLTMVVQVVLARLTTASLPRLPVSWGQVHMVLGFAALGLILMQYIIGDRITVPPLAPGVPRLSVELDPKFGLILGLLAAAGLAYGGFRRAKEPDTLPGIAP